MHYFGREIKFAGNRTYADWTVTIINDENFKMRRAFESWMDFINGNGSNIRQPGSVRPLDYTSDSIVTQFGKAGDPIQEYAVRGMFPVDVSPIELDWGTNDTIEEFQVTFAYQYWESNATQF